MWNKIDLSGETPILVGSPLVVLPAGVRGLAQSSLDDLSAALDPCPAHLVDHAFWSVVAGNAPTTEPWQQLGSTSDIQIDAENKRVLRVHSVENKPLTSYKEMLAAAIDTDARTRILMLVPSWTQANHAEKQRNAIARSVQLLRKIVDETASSEELAEADAIEALWDGVAAIRAASNVAASAISAAQTSEAAYNAAEAVEWPS
jgi:hypothetical protein